MCCAFKIFLRIMLADNKSDWMTGWLIDCMIDWLIDWLIGDVQPSVEEDTAPPSDVVEPRSQRRERDVRELRRRLKCLRTQRNCDDEQLPLQSSSDRDPVKTRLDQLSRSAVSYNNNNKKAELSKRWPRDAPYIWVLWKFSEVPDCAHGYYSRNF